MSEAEKVWACLDELKKTLDKILSRHIEVSSPALDDLSQRIARTEREIKDLQERVYDFIDDLKERIEATNIRQQQVTNDLDDLRDALRTWLKEWK